MSILPTRLQGYHKFISFMLKYWNSNLFDHATANAFGEETKEETDFDRSPRELVEDLKAMGPTYIKLGQLLSTRPDLLPPEYLKALGTLQDDVEPIPFEQIKDLIEEELGIRLSKSFESFDEIPLATASIGQVHTAVLLSGKEVVVKVQRPDVRERFAEDLDTLKEMVALAVKHTKVARQYAMDELLEDMRRILLHELDYTREARNLLTLRNNLKDFNTIIVPNPVLDYTSSRVLTMDYLKGKKITSVSPVKLLEIDSRKLADELVRAYLNQILVDGFVHADPHPGNVHLSETNQIALLDLGMAATIPARMQDYLLQLLLALDKGNGEEVASVMLQAGKLQETNDPGEFTRAISFIVADKQNTSVQDMQMGKLIVQLNQAAAINGLTVPMEINLLGKVLLNLDHTIEILDPDYDVKSAIKRHAYGIMRARIFKDLAPENLLATALEAKKLLEHMPERLNKIMQSLANNELKLNVDAIDEKRITDGFQKVANRITLGLILAAMIIGAAMLMRVETTFTIFGYPGLAILLFLMAIFGGVLLVYFIVFKDENFK